MFDAVANSITRLFDEFSWKRLISAFFIISILIIGFLVYERYTSNFQLSRIQKSAEVLEILQRIETNDNGNIAIKDVNNQLVKELSSVLNSKPWSLTLPKFIEPNQAPHHVAKLVAGAAPWIFFSLFLVPGLLKRQTGTLGALIGFFLAAAFFGWVGTKIPTFFWPWANLVIYPIGHVFLIFFPFILIPQINAYKRRSREAAEANAGSNAKIMVDG